MTWMRRTMRKIADSWRPLPVIAVILAVVLATVPIAATAGTTIPNHQDSLNSQTSQAIGIDSCREIEQSGSYVLTANITARERSDPDGTITCLNIKADDVILDGNGHTIDGEPLLRFEDIKPTGDRNSYAVKISGRDNVTVRNLTTVEFVQGVGVFDSTHVTIEYLHDKRSVEYGVYLGYHADQNVIRYNTLRNSTDKGIAIYEYSDNNSVYGNTIVNNSNLGIAIDEVDGTHIYNNTIVGNGAGIIVAYSDQTVVENNTIHYEDRFWSGGLTVLNSSRSVIADNDIRGDHLGIELWNVTDSRIEENTIRAQENLNLRGQSSSNRLVANEIRGGENGLLTGEQASSNQITGLTIDGTSEQAVLLNGGGDQSLVEVTISDSRGGLEIKSDDNRLSEVTAQSTQRYGVRIDGGQNVSIRDLALSMSSGSPIQAVGEARAVSVSNLSIRDTRIGLTADEFALNSVENPPDPPEGTVIVGAPIELDLPSGQAASVKMLNETEIENGDEVGLWNFDDGWSQLAKAAGSAQNWTLSAQVDGQVVLVLLASAQSSPTESSSSSTASATQTPKSAESTTAPGQPGFGVIIGIGAILAGALWVKRGSESRG